MLHYIGENSKSGLDKLVVAHDKQRAPDRTEAWKSGLQMSTQSIVGVKS